MLLTMNTFIHFSLCLLVVSVKAMYSSKTMEGYPSGFLSDCPGSTKPAKITRKGLRHLSITVQGSGDALTAKGIRYNYYQMEQMIRDQKKNFRKRKTALYVGGYMDSPNLPFGKGLGRAYKKKGYNFWLLDTNRFTTFDYSVAARYMRPVGVHAAEMLANLTKAGLDPKNIEVVGLSLGAQTMSFIAKHYRDITGMKISRLTGLDPAGPCFRNLGPDQRLDKSDADFVDVIDTNIDDFGMAAPVGHVNYYVNGGEFQPGDIAYQFCLVLCSHIRSYTIWLAALENHNCFIAQQCNSVQQARDKKCYDNTPAVTNIVGLKTDKWVQGIFYLATTNNYPYCLGDAGLKRENEIYGWNFLKTHTADVMVFDN